MLHDNTIRALLPSPQLLSAQRTQASSVSFQKSLLRQIARSGDWLWPVAAARLLQRSSSNCVCPLTNPGIDGLCTIGFAS